MSALPILVKHNSLRVGLFTRLRDRELGLDRREPGLFYPTGYAIMIVVWFSTRGTIEYGLWLSISWKGMSKSYAVLDNGWRPLKPEPNLESDGIPDNLCRIILKRTGVLTRWRRRLIQRGSCKRWSGITSATHWGSALFVGYHIWSLTKKGGIFSYISFFFLFLWLFPFWFHNFNTFSSW